MVAISGLSSGKLGDVKKTASPLDFVRPAFGRWITRAHLLKYLETLSSKLARRVGSKSPDPTMMARMAEPHGEWVGAWIDHVLEGKVKAVIRHRPELLVRFLHEEDRARVGEVGHVAAAFGSALDEFDDSPVPEDWLFVSWPKREATDAVKRLRKRRTSLKE